MPLASYLLSQSINLNDQSIAPNALNRCTRPTRTGIYNTGDFVSHFRPRGQKRHLVYGRLHHHVFSLGRDVAGTGYQGAAHRLGRTERRHIISAYWFCHSISHSGHTKLVATAAARG